MKKMLAVSLFTLSALAFAGTPTPPPSQGQPGAPMRQARPSGPRTITSAYQVTPDGHVQITTTFTSQDGTSQQRTSPPFGKAQLNSQITNLSNQLKMMNDQLKVLQNAAADSKLTQP